MKTRAVILAGGDGSRLGILTDKRAKPAVPFAGKYRVIDFTLSNCVNSGIFDVMILAQYRPHSLIEHIGAGVPWDLSRNLAAGVSVHTPYKGRSGADWYAGTADAVQQNYLFIKRGQPDLVIILSGDHVYKMDYSEMIAFHTEQHADLTMATISVPLEDAPRFGIVGVDDEQRVASFVEKPEKPPSTLANMGVYMFDTKALDRALWEDHILATSSHDFGKDILPRMVGQGKRVFAYHFRGYWVDVGTMESYWQAHMDLLASPPPIDLNDRTWIVHTRTEERPPVWIARGARIFDSMITDGCEIAAGATVKNSVLGPGVRVGEGAIVRDSVILTDTRLGAGSTVVRSIADKHVWVGENARVGGRGKGTAHLTTIGKNSHVPANMVVEAGAIISSDVIETDFPSMLVKASDAIKTKRLPYEI